MTMSEGLAPDFRLCRVLLLEQVFSDPRVFDQGKYEGGFPGTAAESSCQVRSAIDQS